jgi:hypothetical protein
MELRIELRKTAKPEPHCRPKPRYFTRWHRRSAAGADLFEIMETAVNTGL